MQEQPCLKMGTAKYPDDAIVSDPVEKPSENWQEEECSSDEITPSKAD
jgi:hypothetical protein